jgi:hypothetical protein
VRHEKARWAAAGREARSSLIAVLSRLVSLSFRPATPPANCYFFVTVHRLLCCFCSRYFHGRRCFHGRDCKVRKVRKVPGCFVASHLLYIYTIHTYMLTKMLRTRLVASAGGVGQRGQLSPPRFRL